MLSVLEEPFFFWWSTASVVGLVFFFFFTSSDLLLVGIFSFFMTNLTCSLSVCDGDARCFSFWELGNFCFFFFLLPSFDCSGKFTVLLLCSKALLTISTLLLERPLNLIEIFFLFFSEAGTVWLPSGCNLAAGFLWCDVFGDPSLWFLDACLCLWWWWWWWWCFLCFVPSSDWGSCNFRMICSCPLSSLSWLLLTFSSSSDTVSLCLLAFCLLLFMIFPFLFTFDAPAFKSLAELSSLVTISLCENPSLFSTPSSCTTPFPTLLPFFVDDLSACLTLGVLLGLAGFGVDDVSSPVQWSDSALTLNAANVAIWTSSDCIIFFFTGLPFRLFIFPLSWSSLEYSDFFLPTYTSPDSWILTPMPLDTSNLSAVLSDTSLSRFGNKFTSSLGDDFGLFNCWLLELLRLFGSFRSTVVIWNSVRVCDIPLSSLSVFGNWFLFSSIFLSSSSPSRSEKVLFGMWPREEILIFGDGSSEFSGVVLNSSWSFLPSLDLLFLLPWTFGVLVLLFSITSCFVSLTSSFSNKWKLFFGRWALEETLILGDVDGICTGSIVSSGITDTSGFFSSFSPSSSREKILLGTGVLEDVLTFGEKSACVSFLIRVFEDPVSFLSFWIFSVSFGVRSSTTLTIASLKTSVSVSISFR